MAIQLSTAFAASSTAFTRIPHISGAGQLDAGSGSWGGRHDHRLAGRGSCDARRRGGGRRDPLPLAAGAGPWQPVAVVMGQGCQTITGTISDVLETLMKRCEMLRQPLSF